MERNGVFETGDNAEAGVSIIKFLLQGLLQNSIDGGGVSACWSLK